MATDKHNNNVDFYGDIRFLGDSVVLPDGTVRPDYLATDEAVTEDKLEHIALLRHFVNGSIADDDIGLGTIDSNFSDVEALDVVIIGAIPVAPNSCTIDLQMAADGGAFATVLSAPITIDSTNALRTTETATIAAAGQNLTGKKHYKLVINDSGTGTAAVDVMITAKVKHSTVDVG
jgi:hypothetical protein